jgi:hypothetical protein
VDQYLEVDEIELEPIPLNEDSDTSPEISQRRNDDPGNSYQLYNSDTKNHQLID